MLKIPILLAAVDGSTSGGSWISEALDGVWPLITKAFSLVTTSPVNYYIALGLIGTAISIFGVVKAVSR